MTALAHKTTPGELTCVVGDRPEVHEFGALFPVRKQARCRHTRKETGLVVRDETMTYSPALQPAMKWPVVSYLELAALPTAVPCFRLHSRAMALEWRLARLAEDIELIVSELVTNAIQAAQRADYGGLAAPVVRLWLVSDMHSILIRVWDGSSQMPARQDAGPDDESGRGLMLVECLAGKWGAYRVEDGKVVWVIVR